MNTNKSQPLSPNLPHIAYILLWYPLFTQPFIFREVENLKKNLPLTIYTLYGPNLRLCSKEMLQSANDVRTLGMKSIPSLVWSMIVQWIKQPRLMWKLFTKTIFKPWPNIEVLGENFWAFFAGTYLGTLLKEDGIDMIHAPWPRGTATAALIASKIANIPFSTCARGDNLQPADPDLKDKLSEAQFIRANNLADLHRIEDFDKKQAKNKVELVYNSLTLPNNDSRNQSNYIRFTQDKLKLLALGRFDVTKGFDILLKACGILKEQSIPFHLTLAGGGGKMMGLGKLEEKLLLLRRELNLESDVSMPGLISHDKLPEILNMHDIFLAPCIIDPSGKRDGIPNTVIEALSFSMPVISTTINALPEIVRHNETGLTVSPNDPKALADAIIWFMNNPEKAIQMGKNGAQLAEEMFNPGNNSKKLAQIFIKYYEGSI